MAHIDAIVFDFDGVLVESATIKTEAFRALFSDWPQHADEMVRYHEANMGISRYVKFRYFYEELLQKRYTDEVGQQLSARFSALVKEAVVAAPMVAGALEFLAQNRGERLLFIASGTPEEELNEILERRELCDYFTRAYGSPATKEASVREILATHSLSPERVAFVGDATSDRDAAHATGVHFVARLSAANSPLLDCSLALWDLTGLEDALRSLSAV